METWRRTSPEASMRPFQFGTDGTGSDRLHPPATAVPDLPREAFLPGRRRGIAGNNTAAAKIASDADPGAGRSAFTTIIAGSWNAAPAPAAGPDFGSSPRSRPTASAPPPLKSPRIGLPIGNLRRIGQVRHALTHRRYVFTAFIATALSAPRSHNRKWIGLEELDQFPLSRPQLKIAAMLRISGV